MEFLRRWPWLICYALLTLGTATFRMSLAYDRSSEGRAKVVLCAKIQVFEAFLLLPAMLLQNKHLLSLTLSIFMLDSKAPR